MQAKDGPLGPKQDGAGNEAVHEADERAVSGMPAWHSYKTDLEQKGYFQVSAPNHCLSLRHTLLLFVGTF